MDTTREALSAAQAIRNNHNADKEARVVAWAKKNPDLSLNALSRMFGMNDDRIGKALRDAGLPPRKRSRSHWDDL